MNCSRCSAPGQSWLHYDNVSLNVDKLTHIWHFRMTMFSVRLSILIIISFIAFFFLLQHEKHCVFCFLRFRLYHAKGFHSEFNRMKFKLWHLSASKMHANIISAHVRAHASTILSLSHNLYYYIFNQFLSTNNYYCSLQIDSLSWGFFFCSRLVNRVARKVGERSNKC